MKADFRQRDEEEALVSKIHQMESRLKYANVDLDAAKKKLADTEKKIKVRQQARGERTHADCRASCSAHFVLCSLRLLCGCVQDLTAEVKKQEPILQQHETSLGEKSVAVSELEAELAKREEKLFRDFSRRVGVANIREFENERLKLAEQYHAEQAAKVTEANNLKNQLEYEKGRDMQVRHHSTHSATSQ